MSATLLLVNCYSAAVGGVIINSVATSSLADPSSRTAFRRGAAWLTACSSPLAKHYLFYDPACPAPVDTSDSKNAALLAAKPYCATGGSGYGKLILTYLSTGNTNPLQVYLCEFNSSGLSIPTNSLYTTVPCSVPSPLILP